MDDLIRRQDAIDAINSYIQKQIPIGTASFQDGVVDGYARCVSILKRLPSAQPEAQKYGHWIKIRDEEDGNTLYECSECHKGECHCHIVEVSYCWNCGARMDGDAVDS